jgi:hypothetical protein
MNEVEVSFAPGAVFDPESARVFFKAEASAALDAAQRSEVGSAFLAFARFPLARVQPSGDGYQVVLRDLRFDTGPSAERNVAAQIDVDANDQVTEQEFVFNTAMAGEDSGGGK